MRTITLELYPFNELAENIQKKVLDEFRYSDTEDNWWKQDYEDAEQIGLKITGFDLDHRGTISGEFTSHPVDVAKAIIENHGETCDTYETAKYFQACIERINEKDMDTDTRDMEIETAESDFIELLLKDYLVMLREDYEYITSDTAVKEMIEANGYEFFVNGERYNKNIFGGYQK